MIKDKPHAIDKWAQEATHRTKCKVGGLTGRPTKQAGRPTHGPHCLQIPHGVSNWLVMAV